MAALEEAAAERKVTARDGLGGVPQPCLERRSVKTLNGVLEEPTAGQDRRGFEPLRCRCSPPDGRTWRLSAQDLEVCGYGQL